MAWCLINWTQWEIYLTRNDELILWEVCGFRSGEDQDQSWGFSWMWRRVVAALRPAIMVLSSFCRAQGTRTTTKNTYMHHLNWKHRQMFRQLKWYTKTLALALQTMKRMRGAVKHYKRGKPENRLVFTVPRAVRCRTSGTRTRTLKGR
jgi:hypothetical protein